MKSLVFAVFPATDKRLFSPNIKLILIRDKEEVFNKSFNFNAFEHLRQMFNNNGITLTKENLIGNKVDIFDDVITEIVVNVDKVYNSNLLMDHLSLYMGNLYDSPRLVSMLPHGNLVELYWNPQNQQ